MPQKSSKTPVAKLIDNWPSRATLAEDLGGSVMSVHHMASRNVVPHKYRYPMAQSALRRGLPVTMDDIVKAASSHVSQNGNDLPIVQPQGKEIPARGDAA